MSELAATIARPAGGPSAPSAAPARIAGLDGLRALAVLAVIAYHAVPAAVPGGFAGVDVFFVISGFLITRLLLAERDATGGMRVLRFWMRRARRLLPALAVLVVVVATVAGLIGGDVTVGLGRQLFGGVTFSSNWGAIAADASYFGASAAEPFRHLWSLAVEEQFYLAWPLILAACVFLMSRGGTMLLLGGTAVLLAGGMAVLDLVGVDRSRLYFGTDIHAFGLLLGAVTALATGGSLAAAIKFLLDRGATDVTAICILAAPEG
ncbi:acyltransferase family protein, partial [Agromyces seonyuensis]|uniref:acyltransferase family protein n=1 Tax=Agromyces seonyuensis TaxID=2662446 RepID=UPI0013652966